MLVLRNEAGDDVVRLDRKRISIGRDQDNDVVIDDATVSGFHAVVVNDNGVLSITDLGSTNGTRVDGRRIGGKTKFRAWVDLELGGVRLRVADPEGREPTRMQPAIGGARGSDAGGGGSDARTQIRPAVSAPAPVPPSAPISGPAPAPTTVLTPAPVAPTVVQGGSVADADTGSGLRGGYPRGLPWLLFSFQGRLRRTVFWKWLLLTGVLFAMLQFVSVVALGATALGDYAYAIFATAFGLATMWPRLAVLAKRLHDTGTPSGLWCAVGALAEIAGCVFLWLLGDRAGDVALLWAGGFALALAVPYLYAVGIALVARGDHGDNDFGDQNPRTRVVFAG